MKRVPGAEVLLRRGLPGPVWGAPPRRSRRPGRTAARSRRRARRAPTPRRFPAGRRAPSRSPSSGAGCRSPCSRGRGGGRARFACCRRVTSGSTGFVTTTIAPSQPAGSPSASSSAISAFPARYSIRGVPAVSGVDDSSTTTSASPDVAGLAAPDRGSRATARAPARGPSRARRSSPAAASTRTISCPPRISTRLNAVDAPTPPAPPTIVTFTAASSRPWAKKSNHLRVSCPRGCPLGPRCDVRRLPRVRAHVPLRESRVDGDLLPHAISRTTFASCSGSTRARSSAWRPAGRSGAASPRSRSCTRPPGSGTRSAPWPPRGSTARRSSSSSASRTGATSRPSRFSRASCAGSRASTRCGSTSPSARRTCPARSRAPTTRRPPRAGPPS